MGHQMRDSFHAHQDHSHFAQLVLGLLWGKRKNSKATLGVTGQIEILFGLVRLILPETAEWAISSARAFNLNELLCANLLSFTSCQGVLKSVP